MSTPDILVHPPPPSDPVVVLALKPSTNGTWFRLSGMHAESRPYPLSNGSEILIGTVRACHALTEVWYNIVCFFVHVL